MTGKRQWISVVVLGLAAAAVWRFTLARSSDTEMNTYARRLLPSQVGPWQGTDLKASKEELEILRTTDVLKRTFRKPDSPGVILSVVFAMDDRTSVHAPEECLVGGGRQIEARSIISYPARLPKGRSAPAPDSGDLSPDMPLGDEVELEVVELILSDASGRLTMVHFFYKAGSDVTPSYLKHEWDMLVSNLLTGSSSNALIKTTTAIEPTEQVENCPEARSRCRDVMRLIFPYAMRALP